MVFYACPTVNLGQSIAESKGQGETSEVSLAIVLANMPQNPGGQCVGISLTIESIIEGRVTSQEVSTSADEISSRIYENASVGKPLVLPKRLSIDGKLRQLVDPASLETISRTIDELYKQDYSRICQTKDGMERLQRVETQFVGTVEQLDRLIQEDEDGIASFCGFGERFFPGGRVEETNHLFLIRKLASGQRVVYDANAPGRAHTCSLESVNGRLVIEWTCPYQDSGQTTRQRYRVVHGQSYFRVFFDDKRL